VRTSFRGSECLSCGSGDVEQLSTDIGLYRCAACGDIFDDDATDAFRGVERVGRRKVRYNNYLEGGE